MILLSATLLTLLMSTTPAEAKTQRPIPGSKFSGCIPMDAVHKGYTRIDEIGNLVVGASGLEKSLSIRTNDLQEEKYEISGSRRKDTYTYTLRKKNGLPQSLTHSYESVEVGKPPFVLKETNLFAYDDKGNCYLNQKIKNEGTKDYLTYDRDLCAKVSNYFKKIGDDKLTKCANYMNNLFGLLKNYNENASKDGKPTFCATAMACEDQEKHWRGPYSNSITMIFATVCELTQAEYASNISRDLNNSDGSTEENVDSSTAK